MERFRVQATRSIKATAKPAAPNVAKSVLALQTQLRRRWKDRKPGIIVTYDYVFEQLKQFSIPAEVWDDVHDELFHQPFGTLALPLQELLFDLEIGKKSSADYLGIWQRFATKWAIWSFC